MKSYLIQVSIFQPHWGDVYVELREWLKAKDREAILYHVNPKLLQIKTELTEDERVMMKLTFPYIKFLEWIDAKL